LSSTSSYPPKSKLDITSLQRSDSETGLEPLIDNEVVFDGDEELVDEMDRKRTDKGKGRAKESENDDEQGELIPYAHRDIKPG
jgi:hypothetical protein